MYGAVPPENPSAVRSSYPPAYTVGVLDTDMDGTVIEGFTSIVLVTELYTLPSPSVVITLYSSMSLLVAEFATKVHSSVLAIPL